MTLMATRHPPGKSWPSGGQTPPNDFGFDFTIISWLYKGDFSFLFRWSLVFPETKSLQMNGWFRWFISFWGTFGQVSGDVWQISFREFFNKLWCLSSLGLSKIGTTTWVGFSTNLRVMTVDDPPNVLQKKPTETPKVSWWVSQAYSAMNFGRIGDRPTGDVPLQVPLMTWGSMVIGSKG